MPHSYGASLAADGRRGEEPGHGEADDPEHDGQDQQHDDGRYWLIVATWTASTPVARSTPSRPGRCAAIGGEDALATVQQPAQGQEDQPGADRQHRAGWRRRRGRGSCTRTGAGGSRRSAAGARPAPCGSARRGDLDHRVVRLVEEGEEVERVVDLRVAVAAVSNTLTARNSPAANVPVSSSSSPAAAAPGRSRVGLVERPILASNWAATISASSVRWRRRGPRRVAEHAGLDKRRILEHGAPGDRVPRRLRALQPDAVDHPDDPHQDHPPGQAGEATRKPRRAPRLVARIR